MNLYEKVKSDAEDTDSTQSDLKTLVEIQRKSNFELSFIHEELSGIRKWVTFFGVLSVISLICGVIAVIAALAQ